MCLDAQGGIKAKRQPFVAGVVLKSCGHERGRRDVLSRTFCQMLELRILTRQVNFVDQSLDGGNGRVDSC